MRASSRRRYADRDIPDCVARDFKIRYTGSGTSPIRTRRAIELNTRRRRRAAEFHGGPQATSGGLRARSRALWDLVQGGKAPWRAVFDEDGHGARAPCGPAREGAAEHPALLAQPWRESGRSICAVRPTVETPRRAIGCDHRHSDEPALERKVETGGDEPRAQLRHPPEDNS